MGGEGDTRGAPAQKPTSSCPLASITGGQPDPATVLAWKRMPALLRLAPPLRMEAPHSHWPGPSVITELLLVDKKEQPLVVLQ